MGVFWQLIGDCCTEYCTSGDNMIPLEEFVGYRKEKETMLGVTERRQGFI